MENLGAKQSDLVRAVKRDYGTAVRLLNELKREK